MLCPRARHRNWYKRGHEIVPIRLKMVDWDEKYQSKQTFYPLLCTGSTQLDPSRQDWKIVDLDVKNQAKQIKTSKRTNQMLLLCPVRLNSHQFMLSACLLRLSYFAEPPHPHQSTICSYSAFRKRLIDVFDTKLQYWMLIAGFGCLRCMWGSRKFCLVGWVSWKLYFIFFIEGSADLASLSKQLDPRDPTSSLGFQ